MNDISLMYGLSNASINALISYVLHVNNNVLSRPYVEKVAASIARQGVTSAYETMEYLSSLSAKKKTSKPLRTVKTEEADKNTIKKPEIDKALSWKEIMAQYEDESEDDEDGEN